MTSAETIINARVSLDGKGWWVGYPDSENCYVPVENMEGAQLLLYSFWADIGEDEKDYKPGQIITPSKKWIEHQRKKARGDTELRKQKKADKAALTSTHKRAGKSASRHSKKAKDDGINYDDTGTRKYKTSKKEKVAKTSGKRRSNSRSAAPASEESEDDNTPLSDRRPVQKGKRAKVTESRSTSVTRGKGKRKAIESDEESEQVGLFSIFLGMKPESTPLQEPPPRKVTKTYQNTNKIKEKKRKRVETSSSESEEDVPIQPPKKKGTARKVVEDLFGDEEDDGEASTSRSSKPKPPPLSIPASSGSQAPSASAPSSAAPASASASPVTATTKRAYEKRGIQRMDADFTGVSGLSTKMKLAQAHAKAPVATLPKFTKISKQQKEAAPSEPASAQTPAVKPPSAGPSSAGPSSGGQSKGPALPSKKNRPALPRRKDSGSVSAPSTPQLDMDVDQQPGPPTAPPAPRASEADRFLRQLAVERDFSGLTDFIEAEDTAMEVDKEPVPPPRLTKAPALPPAELDPFDCIKPIDLVLGASDEPQHVCDMHFFNVTVRRNDTAVPFKAGLGNMDRVILGRFHDYTDLPLLLQACKPVSQLAMVEAASMGDRAGFSMVRDYLHGNDQVALVRFFVFEEWIGNIILFPGAAIRLKELFECPTWYQRDDVLCAALVPWKIVPVSAKPDEHVSMYQFNEAAPSLRSEPVPPVQMSSNMKVDLASKWTSKKARYHEALHVLQFPKEVLEFLVKQDRTFYIHRPSDEFWPLLVQRWKPMGREAEDAVGYETQLLSTVLERGPLDGDKKPSAPAPFERTVWIHVGALSDLGSIPKLVDRLKTHDINFYSYGTHDSVPRQMWGVHTLFTYGGAVTFTPRSLVDDPFWISSLMNQLHEHPAWCCYVPPYVAPSAFAFYRILEAIDEGKCALMTAPPSYVSPNVSPDTPAGQPHSGQVSQDLHDKWHDAQIDVLAMLDCRDILEYALQAFDTKVGKGKVLDTYILDELQDDFARIQIQPPILYEYRRFIIVRGPREFSLRQERFECMTADELVFKDGFFDVSIEGSVSHA
ncbi:hypothetical protein HDZ31DRAFT_42357 [Schizophyllum fasciatum]